VTAATAGTTSRASYDLFIAAEGSILTCWNPASNAVAAISPALSSTNAIMACYVLIFNYFFFLFIHFFNKIKKKHQRHRLPAQVHQYTKQWALRPRLVHQHFQYHLLAHIALQQTAIPAITDRRLFHLIKSLHYYF
jgi:hypothetical protein